MPDQAGSGNGRATGGSAVTLVVLNGRVWTGVPSAPEAQAVAVAGDRIVAVGADRAVRELAGGGTRIIDAGGRRVIPGITDSHTHILSAGTQFSQVSLRAVEDVAGFVKLVAEAAARLRPGEWLLGGEYVTDAWRQPAEPRKEWLDPVTPRCPAYLTRTDHHQALLNSLALKLAGIDADGPPDPPGGEIQRDPVTGKPTGIVKDSAMELITRCIPPPHRSERLAALRAISAAANQWAVTSVHDMSLPDDLSIFREAAEGRKLSLRIHSYVESTDFARHWPALREFDTADGLLRVSGLKTYVDGSLGSRNALMYEPYTDATPQTKHPRGLRSKWAADWDAFRATLRWAHEHGAQLAVHSIGDQANHDLLGALAELPEVRSRRHRIEHAQHLLAEDFARFAELGVIASLQPMHKADDGLWAESAIGRDRVARMYAWGSLLRAGATVCFGSDVPVATNNPFAGMAAAVTGRLSDGRVCAPAQNISIEQALHCYTTAPAFAVGAEREAGTIEPGKLADLAVLEQDILSVGPLELADAVAHTTIVGGRVVWPT